jgi:geranylgeranyl transferase type-2 subunit beta
MMASTSVPAVRCDGVSRRDFLHLGLLTTLGVSLADVLRMQAADGPKAGRATSCILLWLGVRHSICARATALLVTAASFLAPAAGGASESGDWSGAVQLHDLRAQNDATLKPLEPGETAVSRPRAAADFLAGLRKFLARTARPDGSFANGTDPQYRGISDSAYSDLAAVTYAVTLHKSFGWKLPHEEATRRFLLSRQQSNGDFFNVAGTVDPKSAEGRVYNTTQGIVALRALGAKPRYDPLRVFEEILQQDYQTLPAYSTSFFPLAYLAFGQTIPAEADRRIRATMVQAADGYLNNHVAATFHAAHYNRLVGTPTPMPERILERVLRDQKSDGSWFLNMPSRDRHATFDAVFILRQLGHGRADCRAAIERAARWARSCRNADGGFGHFPGSTSDADANYFQAGTLVMAGFLKPVEPLPKDAYLLSWGHLMPLVQ